MSESFAVTPDGLHDHASKVDGFSDRLQVAVDAARQVSMPEDAYGVICQFFPPLLNPVEERGVEALRASVEGMDTVARNLRETVRRYEATDDRHAATFDATMR